MFSCRRETAEPIQLSRRPQEARLTGFRYAPFVAKDPAPPARQMIARAQADVRRLPDSAAAEKASALSNLAAAHLTRADPVDLVAALDATERALQLNPRCAEALHNRALAFHKLFLPEQERRDWQEYLAVETDPGWAGEARAALAALSKTGEPWDRARQQLQRAVASGPRDW